MEDKSNLYMVAIVGMVAIIGIVIMIFGSSTGFGNSDSTGKSIAYEMEADGDGNTGNGGCEPDLSFSDCMEHTPTCDWTTRSGGQCYLRTKNF